MLSDGREYNGPSSPVTHPILVFPLEHPCPLMFRFFWMSLEKETLPPPETYPNLNRSYVKKFFFVKKWENDNGWFLRKRLWILIIFSPCIIVSDKCFLSTILGIVIRVVAKEAGEWMIWCFQRNCSQVRETSYVPQACFCLRTFALAVSSDWDFTPGTV